MDGSQYDVIIMGTGITQSILSGLLSLDGKKVLHIDKNHFYGDMGASLNITSLWEKFRPNEKPPKELGENRDWNIDLIPKFIMAYGKLVKMIIKTKVSEYLSWKCVSGIYVYQYSQGGFFSDPHGKIDKVPGNDKEALTSSLMSLFEKRRCQKFFQFVQKFDKKDPNTYQKIGNINQPFGNFVKDFGLESNTIDFMGHAVAMYTSDQFMQAPAVEVIEKVATYINSTGRFGDSPFIYPVYGLAGIPESFSRKCAVYGGTFMLNVKIDDLVYNENDKMTTLQGSFEDEKGTAKAPIVIGNPQYFVDLKKTNMVKPISKILRCICIIDHKIPHTGDNESVQIILPQKQTKRNSDIYIMEIGPQHGVCKKGYFLAIISTTPEKENHEEDLKVAFELIGPIKYKFYNEEVMYAPVNTNPENKWFITDTLDPTSHFDSAAENVIKIYKSITGKDIDLDNLDKTV